jgi:hypothetical protein
VNSTSIADASTEDLTAELAKLLRKGLPVTEATAGGVLPNLRSVYARAIHPEVGASRIDALNELLPRLIGTIEDESYSEATRILFGLATGTRGTLLSTRQRQAAKQLGYNADHFRQRVQAGLVTAVAEVVHRDLLRYQSRVKRAVESLEPTGDTPKLNIDDLTQEEELVSRIWQHVYGLRAELIGHLRLLNKAGYEGQAEDHRQAANQQHDELQRLIGEYVETYGKRLIEHGDAEYRVEALERLAGWKS